MINDEMIMDELFLPRDDSQDNYISSNCLFDLEDQGVWNSKMPR